MTRSLPPEAYLPDPCPRCGGVMLDLMGDEVCLNCDLAPAESKVKKFPYRRAKRTKKKKSW